jgi:3-oxoacyl-[acyl-carrier-protein] synthase II
VTALGESLERTWEALLAGRYITTHSPAKLNVNTSLARVTQLALAAARDAIAEARWGGDVLRDDRTALLVGTSRGPINQWLAGITTPEIGVHTVANDLARELRMGGGPRLTYSAACASGLQALIRAVLMMRSGEIDRALVVGAEAALHPLFLACFDRLGVLPKEGIGCRPFDETRDGFLVTEAAAAVCLERPETARAFATIEAFALGSDATTITAADPSGRVLRNMLRHIVQGRAMDLVHAHGTGTQANDPVELAAIESECVGEASPIVYSHKGSLGHSLGASGLNSVVLNCAMHEHQVAPGNVRTTQSISRLVSPEARQASIRRSLAIAAGFGGPVAAVSLIAP